MNPLTGLFGDEILFKQSRCWGVTSDSLLSDLTGLIVIAAVLNFYFQCFVRFYNLGIQKKKLK